MICIIIVTNSLLLTLLLMKAKAVIVILAMDRNNLLVDCKSKSGTRLTNVGGE